MIPFTLRNTEYSRRAAPASENTDPKNHGNTTMCSWSALGSPCQALLSREGVGDFVAGMIPLNPDLHELLSEQ